HEDLGAPAFVDDSASEFLLRPQPNGLFVESPRPRDVGDRDVRSNWCLAQHDYLLAAPKTSAAMVTAAPNNGMMSFFVVTLSFPVTTPGVLEPTKVEHQEVRRMVSKDAREVLSSHCLSPFHDELTDLSLGVRTARTRIHRASFAIGYVAPLPVVE